MEQSRWRELRSRLKWLVALGLAVAVAAGVVACGGGDDEPVVVRPAIQANSTLTGDQEVPPVITGGVGSGTLALDSANALSGSITLDGLPGVVAAHIHQGEIGQDGPVIVPLVQTAANTWSVPAGVTLSDEQRNALLDGKLYYNAHTAANPDGEVRGQIGVDVFNVQLNGGQEVPPTASAATGAGRLILNPLTRRFSAVVTTAGVAGIAAHIHDGVAGADGPILFPLTETAPGSGIWVAAGDAVMTDDQVAALRAGRFYFNVHSVAFPDGEIRGQIGLIVGTTVMTGPQEVPPTPSTATGTGVLMVNPLTRAASGSIQVTGMNTIDAHIHLAPPGIDGPIIIPLANSAPNVWVVPANTVMSVDNFAALKRGDLYYNAHSPTFPGGEIRGQIR